MNYLLGLPHDLQVCIWGFVYNDVIKHLNSRHITILDLNLASLNTNEVVVDWCVAMEYVDFRCHYECCIIINNIF